MDRINQIKEKLNGKIPTLQKQVPTSEETALQMRIDTLLPNDLHNLENPSIYLQTRRKNAQTSKQNFQELFFDPYIRTIVNKIFDKLIQDKSFELKDSYEMSLDEYKNYTNELLGKMVQYSELTPDDFQKNHFLFRILVFTSYHLNYSTSTKFMVHYGLYCTTLKELGTEKHLPYLRRAYGLKDLGCFMMTEIAHGSNVQGLLTTAHYINERRSFIINTPHEMGMKFWIGNLARTANYGVCFANLLLGNQDYGIHIFLMQLRDDRGNLLPGIEVGDCGHKMGVNGIDNGWAMFRRVEIPYDFLLDRYSQIDINGNYQTQIPKKTERFALQLNALSGGRIGVANISSGINLKIEGIGLRYLCVRKQFGNKKYTEDTLINYPLVQDKLFSQIAKSIVFREYSEFLYKQFTTLNVKNVKDPIIKELHAQSSYLKCAASYQSMTVGLVVRELCGGHGFSSYSGIGEMIGSVNVQMTWEGTNDVLIQQTAKVLLDTLTRYVRKGKIEFKTFEFLPGLQNEEKVKSETQRINQFLLDFDCEKGDYKVLSMCIKRFQQIKLKNLMEIIAQKFGDKITKGVDLQEAFNSILPQSLLDLCYIYGEYKALEFFEKYLEEITAQQYQKEKEFFIKIFLIYGLKSLKDHCFYLSDLITIQSITKLDEICFFLYPKIIDDCVVYIDSFLPPDELVNSVLGKYDGDVYRRIIGRMKQVRENNGKSDNWSQILKLREMINFKQFRKFQKLQ